MQSFERMKSVASIIVFIGEISFLDNHMDTTLFFEYYYNNAEVNSILIMDSGGVVLDVNRAFTQNFGYDKEEIKGKNFTVLFVEKDKEEHKPEHELNRVLSTGQSHEFLAGRRGPLAPGGVRIA